jgi:hypothetical protein
MFFSYINPFRLLDIAAENEHGLCAVAVGIDEGVVIFLEGEPFKPRNFGFALDRLRVER